MNAIVLGAGRSGVAAASLLRGEGWQTTILEGKVGWPHGEECGLCVVSPGVPLTHEWQIEARRSGVPVVSELQLGAEHFARMGGKMLAVTGSKGKSSVVKLVADAIGGIPCGNYGLPLCEVALRLREGNDRPRWAVVEVSSFQMETTELAPDAFEAAAILNLQEDHLDRHGTKETYHALKRRLLDFAKVRIAGSGVECADAVHAESMRGADLMAGSYFDNPILRSNGLCAVGLMRAAGLSDDAIRAAFAHFEPLPHRMQPVGTANGVTWIDDSKATSIAALVAGVEMASSQCGDGRKIHLIAGGLPKGDDPAAAVNALAGSVCKVYLIGKCAQEFADAWRAVVPCEVCGTLERAVASARACAKPSECVLLSPGTASFDQFGSYCERGDRFAFYAGTRGANAV